MIGEGNNYTQGVGITYEVDFDTFKELVNKIFNKPATVEKDKNSVDALPDNEMTPDYIKFDKNKKKAAAPSGNKEGILNEDH